VCHRETANENNIIAQSFAVATIAITYPLLLIWGLFWLLRQPHQW